MLLDGWVIKKVTKVASKKLVLHIYIEKRSKEKVFFSFVWIICLRMCCVWWEIYILSWICVNKTTIKKWKWYDFAGFSQNEIIFEGGNERNSSSSKMEWCMVKGEETWFNQRSFVLFAHLLGLNGCSLDVVPNSLQYYYSSATTLFSC